MLGWTHRQQWRPFAQVGVYGGKAQPGLCGGTGTWLGLDPWEQWGAQVPVSHALRVTHSSTMQIPPTDLTTEPYQ